MEITDRQACIKEQSKSRKCSDCICMEAGYYSFCGMVYKVLCLEEPLNCECLQHTLCDDESSQCCRCFYYTFLGCGCNWCLPKCEECGAVKVLERGICDECWDHMLDLIKNLGDALRRMQGEYREFKFQAQFDPKQAQNPTQNPCMNPPPFIDRNIVLEKNGITDRLSAKKWLIQHHPDKTKQDEFDIDEFQEILNYYKSYL